MTDKYTIDDVRDLVLDFDQTVGGYLKMVTELMNQAYEEGVKSTHGPVGEIAIRLAIDLREVQKLKEEIKFLNGKLSDYEEGRVDVLSANHPYDGFVKKIACLEKENQALQDGYNDLLRINKDLGESNTEREERLKNGPYMMVDRNHYGKLKIENEKLKEEIKSLKDALKDALTNGKQVIFTSDYIKVYTKKDK